MTVHSVTEQARWCQVGRWLRSTSPRLRRIALTAGFRRRPARGGLWQGRSVQSSGGFWAGPVPGTSVIEGQPFRVTRCAIPRLGESARSPPSLRTGPFVTQVSVMVSRRGSGRRRARARPADTVSCPGLGTGIWCSLSGSWQLAPWRTRHREHAHLVDPVGSDRLLACAAPRLRRRDAAHEGRPVPLRAHIEEPPTRG